MIGKCETLFHINNKCLFQYWTPYVGKNPHPVLKKLVKCEGIETCYRTNLKITQYASCYDQKTGTLSILTLEVEVEEKETTSSEQTLELVIVTKQRTNQSPACIDRSVKVFLFVYLFVFHSVDVHS